VKSTLEIVRVPSARGFAAREFLQLPERIYRGCDRWVPILRTDARLILARRHPFFERQEAEFLIARRNGETRGSIAVFGIPHRPRTRGSRTAHFHFFESFNDQEVADALFGAACAWARARGLHTLEGPVGFGMLGSGILMDHYESRAAMSLTPYNHEYYPRLLEGFGFAKREDVRSFQADGLSVRLPEKMRRAAETALKKGGFLVPEKTGVAELRAWGKGPIGGREENRGDAPWKHPLFSQPELRTWSEPQLLRLLSLRGEQAGFLAAFPDISLSLIRGKGSRRNGTPQTERRLIVGGFGMLPRFRCPDGSAVLCLELERLARSGRFDSVEVTGIAESDEGVPADLKAMGLKAERTHRIFRYAL